MVEAEDKDARMLYECVCVYVSVYYCVFDLFTRQTLKMSKRFPAHLAFIGAYKYAFLSFTIRELQSKSSKRCEIAHTNGMT